MKTKYIIMSWAWPILSMILFVAAMLLLIHEVAFYNCVRKDNSLFALFGVMLTFVNGFVSIFVGSVIRGRYLNYKAARRESICNTKCFGK